MEWRETTSFKMYVSYGYTGWGCAEFFLLLSFLCMVRHYLEFFCEVICSSCVFILASSISSSWFTGIDQLGFSSKSKSLTILLFSSLAYLSWSLRIWANSSCITVCSSKMIVTFLPILVCCCYTSAKSCFISDRSFFISVTVSNNEISKKSIFSNITSILSTFVHLLLYNFFKIFTITFFFWKWKKHPKWMLFST